MPSKGLSRAVLGNRCLKLSPTHNSELPEGVPLAFSDAHTTSSDLGRHEGISALDRHSTTETKENIMRNLFVNFSGVRAQDRFKTILTSIICLGSGVNVGCLAVD